MQEDNLVTFDPRVPKDKPYITKILIVFISLMFFVEILFTAQYGDKAIILLGAKWNPGITNGEYWRFITCTFLHGNLIHLLLNLAVLYIFGKEVESLYGSFRFVLIYLFSSWGGSLASYMFSPHIAIGASGAAFGIIGSLVVFYFKQRGNVTGAEYQFKSMYTLIIINLLLGFILPKIDYFGHIGGLILGIISAYFLTPEYVIEKNEELNKLTVLKKPNSFKTVFGLIFVLTILTWLTKTAIK